MGLFFKGLNSGFLFKSRGLYFKKNQVVVIFCLNVFVSVDYFVFCIRVLFFVCFDGGNINDCFLVFNVLLKKEKNV